MPGERAFKPWASSKRRSVPTPLISASTCSACSRTKPRVDAQSRAAGRARPRADNLHALYSYEEAGGCAWKVARLLRKVVSCNPPPAWSPAYRSSFKLSTPLPRTSPRRGLPSRGAFGLLGPAPPWCEPRSSPAPSRRARHRCARGSTIRCLGIEVVAASSNSSRQTLARKG